LQLEQLLITWLGSKTHAHIISTTCINCHSNKGIPCPPLPCTGDAVGGQGDEINTTSDEMGKPLDSANDLSMSAQVEMPKAFSKSGRRRQRQNAKLPPMALRRDAGHLIFVGGKAIDGQ
jgi:hypothetical protein